MAETGARKTPQWCSLSLARYAVAVLVGILAIAVVAKTMSMALRPRQFKLVISQGYIQVDYFPVLPPPGNLTIRFHAVVYNPTVYDINYNNIRVKLLDVASSPPGEIFVFDIWYQIHLESLAWFNLKDWETAVPYEQVPGRYLSKLYDGSTVQVAMRVEGMLTKTPQSLEKPKKTSRVVYYCWPVVLGFDDDISRNDVSCSLQVDHY